LLIEHSAPIKQVEKMHFRFTAKKSSAFCAIKELKMKERMRTMVKV